MVSQPRQALPRSLHSSYCQTAILIFTSCSLCSFERLSQLRSEGASLGEMRRGPGMLYTVVYSRPLFVVSKETTLETEIERGICLLSRLDIAWGAWIRVI